VTGKKETKMFSQYLLQNLGDSDKMWYIVSWLNLLQNHVDVFHLT